MILKLGHINVRSLIGKVCNLRNLIELHNLDVVGVTETWLSCASDLGCVNIPGFSFVHVPRPTRGGGVGVYIRDTICFDILCQDIYCHSEHLWFNLAINGKKICVAVIYRPNENFNDFLSVFEEYTALFHLPADEFVCLGDFNCNALSSGGRDFGNLTQVLDSFNLKQIIANPTRITPTSSTLIDLVIVTVCAPIVDSGVWAVHDIADHSLVSCTLSLGNGGIHRHEITFRNLNNIRMDVFIDDLHSIPWFRVFDIPNINDKLVFFNTSLVALFDRHAPLISRTFNRPPAPWLTSNIRLMMRMRDDAYNKCRRTHLHSDWLYYRQLRNYVSGAVKRERRAYISYTFNNKKSKDIWSAFRRLNIVPSRIGSLPASLSDAEAIGAYFASVFNGSLPNFNLLHFYHSNLRNGSQIEFEFTEITEEEVGRIIASLTSNAIGIDGISLKMLKLCCPFLLLYIKHIVNCCISSCTFPDCWKESMVRPLPKVSSPTEVSDLRPISILPTLSKVCERVLLDQLRGYLRDYNILPETQSGFRSGHSCCSALLSVTDDIIAAADEGKITALVLLDFSKAFDTINHELLISILHYIGLGSCAEALLRSYIINRHQRVVIGDVFSSPALMTSGVPQGSILGPTLFSIYSAFIMDKILLSKFHMYADDSQLYFSFSPDDVEEGVRSLNSDLESLRETCWQHNLHLNAGKCSVVVFGSALARQVIVERFKIHINSVVLPVNGSARVLGVILDSSLRFKEHITRTLQKCYAALKLLYRNRHILHQTVKTFLCDSIVLSNLNYCDVLYNRCIDGIDKKRIQRVQNSCLRFIFGIRRRSPVSHTLERVGWLCMAERRSLHACCFYHGLLVNASPPYLYNRIRFRSDVHNLNIRHRFTITIPRHRLELFKRSFSYSIVYYYNKIPLSLKTLSVPSFKFRLKHLLLHQRLSF